MNKKLIALAVAGATFAPAVMAQTANPVTLYGRVWVMLNNIKADGGANPLTSRNTVVNESSLLGVRGTEDLGGGLKGFFQLEMGFAPEENVTTIATLSPTPTTTPLNINNTPFSGRNSAVGLQGGFGSILLGRWDTPFKLSAIFMDPYGQNTIGNQLAVINTGTFNRRETNTVQYWSPTISGFALRGMYSANEGKANARAAIAATATAFAQPAVVAVNPSSMGFSLAYATGPINLNYAYEKHKDQRGSAITAGVNEVGHNVAGTFVFGAIKIGLDTQRIKSPDRRDKKASMAAVTYTVGKNQFMAIYGQLNSGAALTAASPESKMSSLGYDYNFSRRTTFMARFATLKNNGAANNDYQVASSGLPVFAVDNDPKGFGAGFRHTF